MLSERLTSGSCVSGPDMGVGDGGQAVVWAFGAPVVSLSLAYAA